MVQNLFVMNIDLFIIKKNNFWNKNARDDKHKVTATGLEPRTT